MHLKGIYAPIVTPFDADEEINYPVLEQLIDYLLANGVVGLVPGGTMGEVYAFSDSERLELFQFVKDYVGKKATLIAGVNAGATRDVIRFSQAAAKMGYNALMVAVPPYSRPTQCELLSHDRDVATSVDLPIVLYNFPWRAGTEVGYDVLDGLVDQKNVVGIKEASSDPSRVYGMLQRYGDCYQIVCGSDGQASCAPRQHADVLDAALAGDFVTARARAPQRGKRQLRPKSETRLRDAEVAVGDGFGHLLAAGRADAFPDRHKGMVRADEDFLSLCERMVFIN